MAEKAGHSVVIKISGTATAFTTEATSTSDNQTYQITNTVKRVWDRDTTPTVYDDAVETVESYTVNYLNGTITFASVDAERVITVTGNYLPMTTAAYAHDYSRTKNCTLNDITAFGDSYVQRQAGMKSASGTLSQFNVVDTTFVDALVAGDPIVIEDEDDTGSEPNRFWALLSSAGVTAAVNGVQDQPVSWESHDEWITLGG